MSPIGRMFIVLNLVLAAAFLGWASNALSTVQDYKGQAAAAKKEMADAVAAKDARISDLEVAKQNLEAAQGRFREERDLEKAQKERLQGDLADAKRNNDQMQASLAKIESTLTDYKALIEQLSGDKDRYQQVAAEAASSRDDAVDAQQAAELARRDAEEALQNARREIAQLESARNQIQAQLAQAETQLTVLAELTNTDLGSIQAVPKIDAAVLDVREVDNEYRLVMLNKGENDGVKRGFTFDIYRGQSYKGRAKVETVQADYCSALIVNTVESKTISPGDRASTRL